MESLLWDGQPTFYVSNMTFDKVNIAVINIYRPLPTLVPDAENAEGGLFFLIRRRRSGRKFRHPRKLRPLQAGSWFSFAPVSSEQMEKVHLSADSLPETR